jgi:predicted DNA-binding transcriptional regulator AlpA
MKTKRRTAKTVESPFLSSALADEATLASTNSITPIFIIKAADGSILPVFVNEAETARITGMSRIYLRKSRCEGNREGRTDAPPFVRINGHSIRYRLSDIIQWCDSHST